MNNNSITNSCRTADSLWAAEMMMCLSYFQEVLIPPSPDIIQFSTEMLTLRVRSSLEISA